MNDNESIKEKNECKCCCKICCIILIILLIANLIMAYYIVINKILSPISEDKEINITCLICISTFFITIIICLTTAICKYIQSKKDKCNSYDEALTKLLNK